MVTDEAFRRRFADDAVDVLREVTDAGVELTPCELHALACIDAEVAERFADAIDPRIQKADIGGSRP